MKTQTIIFHFSIAKTIQASAVLLKAESSPCLSRLRLLKLLYIADRESLCERARPITGDRPVAMDHGPVLSVTYDLIKGEDFLATEWGKFIQNQGARDLVLIADPGVGDLSRYEIAKLHDVSKRFESLNDWEIAEFTHKYQEWIDHKPPIGSCNPIPGDDLLKVAGLEKIKDQLAADVRAETAMAHLLEST